MTRMCAHVTSFMVTKGPCKVKKVPDIQKNIWIELNNHPTPDFFFWKPIFDTIYVDFIGFPIFIQNGPGPIHPLLNFFLMFGIFLNLLHSQEQRNHNENGINLK